MGTREIDHSPAYVMPLNGSWRIVVPIRGKLSPKVLRQAFPTKGQAGTWLGSDLGREAVAAARERRHSQATASLGIV